MIRVGDNDERIEDFAHLLLGAKRRLHAYILTLVPNWVDAEEVEQKTAIVLWQKFDEFEPGTNFTAWACRIARLQIANFRRVQGRSRVCFNDDLVATLARMQEENCPTFEARRSALEHCIEQLSTEESELIDCCYGTQIATVKEVAKNRGQSTNAVYKSLARIRRRLFLCIEHRVSAGGGR
jgi:RNA polymerase sigma-70 factor (ECF subfamily)